MRKSLLFNFIIFLGIITISSCSSNRFVSNNFDAKTKTHKSIAVVPVKMIFTGKLPNDITPDQVTLIEESESQEFQRSFQTSILRSTRRGKRPMNVEMQSANLTNSLLEKADISIRDSWDMNPQELADILGVDAVVTSKITKERYLSEEASYAISTGVAIARQLGGIPGVPIPSRITRTYDINVDVAAVDGQSGETLFSNRDLIAINWSCTPEQAIEKVNKRLTRRFPYSKKQ